MEQLRIIETSITELEIYPDLVKLQALVLAKNSIYLAGKFNGGIPTYAVPNILKKGASYVSGEVIPSTRRPFYFEFAKGVRPSTSNILEFANFYIFKKYTPWMKPIDDIVLRVSNKLIIDTKFTLNLVA